MPMIFFISLHWDIKSEGFLLIFYLIIFQCSVQSCCHCDFIFHFKTFL